MQEQTHDRRRKWKPGSEALHPEPRMLEIVEDLRAGVFYREIAERYSVTTQRIYAIRRSAGLPPRYRKVFA